MSSQCVLQVEKRKFLFPDFRCFLVPNAIFMSYHMILSNFLIFVENDIVYLQCGFICTRMLHIQLSFKQFYCTTIIHFLCTSKCPIFFILVSNKNYHFFVSTYFLQAAFVEILLWECYNIIKPCDAELISDIHIFWCEK